MRYHSLIPCFVLAAVALAAASPADARAQVTPTPKERAPIRARAALQRPPVVTQTASQDTLICRGGGDDTGLMFRVSQESVDLRMSRRGTAPASAGLAPGECSFAHRAFATGDPQYVRYLDEYTANGIVYPRSMGVDVVYGPWPECGTNPFQVKCTWSKAEFAVVGRELLGWLNDLLDPAKQWVLVVTKHQGRGCPTQCWRLLAATANPSPVPLKP